MNGYENKGRDALVMFGVVVGAIALYLAVRWVYDYFVK